MSVGNQPTVASINQSLTNTALNLRNICGQITDLQEYISSLGTTGLQALGFTAADAQNIVTLVGYMNTVAAVYFGTAAQPTASNFNAALTVLWAGQ